MLTVFFAAQVAPASAGPTVSFSPSPQTVRIGASVSFTATVTSSAAVSSVRWEFGDGTSTAGSAADYTVSHPYGSTGSMTVTLTVIDVYRATATATGTVTVTGPSASFSFSRAPDVGEAVAFNGSASSDPAGGLSSYGWDFGDGTSDTSGTASPTHSYSSGGDKTVTLTVTAFDGREASFARVVNVNLPPLAAFVYAGVDTPAGRDPFTPVTGQRVAFTAQGSSDPDGSVASYAWDFGSGTFGEPATAPYVVTTFADAGQQTVRLRVTDNRGATATTTVPIRVQKTALKVLRGVGVQFSGLVTAGGTRVARIAVRAPAGALVVARCLGPGCPRRALRQRVGIGGSVHLKKLERTLRAGARIAITVSKPGFVSRVNVLTARRGRAPSRRAGCALPGAQTRAMKLGPCPRS